MRNRLFIIGVLFLSVFSSSNGYCFKDGSHVYATWDIVELDTCASAWLIKNFVDPQAEFAFFPKDQVITRGIAFDTPDAKFRRIQNYSTFEVILQNYKIHDAVLQKIGALVHSIEINYWQDNAPEQALQLNQIIVDLKKQFHSPQDVIKESFPAFQKLYETLKAQ